MSAVQHIGVVGGGAWGEGDGLFLVGECVHVGHQGVGTRGDIRNGEFACGIRGYGALDLSDNAGNRGRLTLDRSGEAFVSISREGGQGLTRKERLAGD